MHLLLQSPEQGYKYERGYTDFRASVKPHASPLASGYHRSMATRVLIVLWGSAGLWAQGQTNQRQAAADPAIERGRVQFAQSCAFCHGVNANGGTHGPSLIRSAVVRHDENGNLMGPVIHDGRPDRGMPPVPLSANQVSDIVAFVKSRVSAADIRSANRGLQGSSDKLLTGNADAGKAFFQGAGGCSNCHSPAGDLAGIARKYTPDVLQARFLYPQRRRTTVTVTEAGGKQYTGDLLALTNYDVSMQDAAGWYHSWPLESVKVDAKEPLAAHRALLQKYTDSDMHNMLAYLETLK
jgi:cytochrome c oxidase cbb3-type subunit 3